ncbi:MAG: hypothetical protein J6S43_05365 [Lentisphaeria bacterium]|nr:hypothetical protein [Lentisphaeria bacterium]
MPQPECGIELSFQCKTVADQAEWKYFEHEFVFHSKKNRKTTESVLKVGGKGRRIDLADLKLLPVNEIAVKHSADCFQSMKTALVPGFVLRYIPHSKPEVDFYWLGKAPCKLDEVRTSGGKFPISKFDFTAQ